MNPNQACVSYSNKEIEFWVRPLLLPAFAGITQLTGGTPPGVDPKKLVLASWYLKDYVLPSSFTEVTSNADKYLTRMRLTYTCSVVQEKLLTFRSAVRAADKNIGDFL